MTEKQARELAKMDRYYSARCIHGQWHVWDAQSDTCVEFDNVWSPCVTAIGTDHDGVEFD
jgi:hypothetical protein